MTLCVKNNINYVINDERNLLLRYKQINFLTKKVYGKSIRHCYFNCRTFLFSQNRGNEIFRSRGETPQILGT